MSNRVAIELNDTGIIVNDGFRVIQNSPGFIIDLAHQSWIGKEAYERAFLFSNECQNKFWSEIACAEDNSIDRTNIKLAMRHMAFVWQQVPFSVNAVVLIVPETFTKTALGVLLGICNELQIPVNAMVHQAVLAPYQHGHRGDTLHIDIQLHHTAITKLIKHGQEFAVDESKVVSGVGLLPLYVHVAEFISKKFIVETRLDPLHSAQLEQQLHSLLPQWLQDSQHNESIICQLQHQNDSFEVIIDSRELFAVYQPLVNNILRSIKSISTSDELIVCIPEWFEKLFGFRFYAHKEAILVRAIDIGYYAKQSFDYEEETLSNDGQVYLNKQLPYKVLTDELESPVCENHYYEKPDHVLFDHCAYPIKKEIYIHQNQFGKFELLYEEPASENTLMKICNNVAEVSIEFGKQQAIKINERKAKSYSKLAVGDHIMIDGYDDVFMLIKVES